MDQNSLNQSNKDVNWAEHYDVYETQFREMYNNSAKPQNESHFLMLTNYGKKYHSKESVFCEIGFGSGVTLRLASKVFSKVYGLDISPKNVELTSDELKKENYKNIDVRISDLMVFDSKYEGKFDVISYIHGLEHFSSDDYPVFFDNIKRYLKNEGIFSGALPHDMPFNFRICPKCGELFEIDGHLSRHTKESLRSLFEKNGFEILHLDTFNLPFILSNTSGVKRVLKKFKYSFLKIKPKTHAQLEYIVKGAKLK